MGSFKVTPSGIGLLKKNIKISNGNIHMQLNINYINRSVQTVD